MKFWAGRDMPWHVPTIVPFQECRATPWRGPTSRCPTNKNPALKRDLYLFIIGEYMVVESA